jgi:hypothetical protein
MHRSHLTQNLLNYFDETDTRTREHPWTIEAQLLNSIACSIEESDVRFSREVDSVLRGRTPLNLDNRGVWYRVQLPFGGGAPSTVIGRRGEALLELNPYDDYMPVPSGIEYDPSRRSTPLQDPGLFSISGNGLPFNSGPLELAIPNCLYFQVEGLGDFNGVVDLLVEGHTHPRMYWAAANSPVVEKVEITDEGVWITANTWEDISNITVRNLPAGASLKSCLLPLSLSHQPDRMRTFTDPAFRDVEYPRYWSVDGRLVKDLSFAGRFAGYNICQTYYWNDPVASVAVEPNTYGLLVVAASNLYYVDRREPVPDNLYRTSISQEPLYGLQVVYDQTTSGDQRRVVLTPVPYVGSSEMVQYRYWVQDPNGLHWILTGSGELTNYGANSGWLRGTPGPITMSLPNSECGTWFFVLECIDQAGNRIEDRAPYLHAALSPLRALDVSQVVPQVAGVSFDSRSRLWLWTGDLLVPARFSYDAYGYDADSNSLYLTDSYDEVQIA